MKIAGIDPSMNGTAVVKLEVDDKFNILKKDFLATSSVKKHANAKVEGVVIHFNKKDYKNYFQEWEYKLQKIVSFVRDCEYVAFEDYSYASKGNNFHIGEFVGNLKFRVLENSKIQLYDPNSVKMFGGGHGAADAVLMWEGYCKDPYFDLTDLPPIKTAKKVSPTSDIIDAYFICNILLTEMRLRNGLLQMRDLKENVIRIFNRTTKAHPVNILDRDFVSLV